MRDLIVVGGGPAGLAAAIRARQLGLDCLVLEPKPAPIDKACGEGLMPATLAHLETLGVDDIDGHPFTGIRYVDATRPDCSATGDFATSGLGVRRTTLHRRLWQRADHLGVEWVARRASEVSNLGDAVRADDQRARYLIAADGLHSSVRRQLGIEVDEGAEPRYGVRRHFAAKPWTDRVEVHWSRRAEAYVTPVGPQLVGVALLADGGGRFSELMNDFPHLLDRLDGADPVTEVRGGGPFEKRPARRVDGRVLFVGDAAGYLDPLTGEGVALGLATACAAVDAIVDGRPESYERHYRKLTREYWLLTGLLLGVSRLGWLHRPMIRLFDLCPPIFDGALNLLGGRKEKTTPVPLSH